MDTSGNAECVAKKYDWGYIALALAKYDKDTSACDACHKYFDRMWMLEWKEYGITHFEDDTSCCNLIELCDDCIVRIKAPAEDLTPHEAFKTYMKMIEDTLDGVDDNMAQYSMSEHSVKTDNPKTFFGVE